MTELQFQKQITNDKNEIIFHFCAITNIFSGTNCIRRFDGDVIVNLSRRETFISPRALSGLMDDQISSVLSVHKERLKELKGADATKVTKEFMNMKCKEAVIAELFERCAKLKDVIL